MEPTLAFTSSATSFTEGDLSSIVAVGSSQADVRFKNISDVPFKLFYRKTGTTGVGENTDISPQESSGNITIALTTARTIECYIEGGGTVECWVVDYGGSGVVTAVVTVADIRTTLLDSGYSTDDISNAAIQGYIDIINNRVTKAATRHANIALYALDDATKTDAIKLGAAWLTLNLIINIAASHGIVQDKINASAESRDGFQGLYKEMFDDIMKGTVY